MLEPLVILLAFLAGLGFRKLGYPPLLGYLLAGFVAHEFQFGSADAIAPIADLGILLLLFTIGLKLNLKELAAPQVWGVVSLHMLIVIPLTALTIILASLVVPSLSLVDAQAAWVLAFALSFSSTVFAVKIFDERGEGAALHSQIAIGILIVQDLVAVAYLVVLSDSLPSIYALGLLLLPLLRPVLLYLLRMVGHGELLVLFGICVAIGTGELFEWVHLKAGLGALVAGVLLGNANKSVELYKGLLDFKDIFLIGFFLQVGYYGLPSPAMMLVAVALSLMIFLRPILYFLLLVAFRLRARTALLTGLSLFNYSEFGLIVAALATQAGLLSAEWLTTLALAMSLSFFIAVPFNTRAHDFYARFSDVLHKCERQQRLSEEQAVELGDAKILVLGMGRVGMGAYQYLRELYHDDVVGVEENMAKAQQHIANGVNCVPGDATDYDFLDQIDLAKRDMVLISLTNHAENVAVVKLLKKHGFQGRIAVASRFPDQEQELRNMGCITFNLYAEAGHGFAEHVLSQV